MEFVNERLKKGEKIFEPIHKQKLNTMANMKKSVKLKTTQNKLIEFQRQGNIITKLLVKSQEENLKYDMAELMKYCLTPIPYSLGTADSFFVKTDKLKSLTHLTKDVEDQPLPPANDMLTMEDGNALFHYLKELRLRQICLKLYNMTAHCGVIVSTDMYVDDSVKNLERKRRGVADKLIVKGSSTRKSKD